MCGIVGYVGGRGAVPILLDGLRRLEYRGYDSAGMAVVKNGVRERRQAAKARGGRVLAVASAGDDALRPMLDGPGDALLEIPPCPEPRSLAKSVTVE